MFCDQCQAFWQEALSKAQIPEVVNSCQDVRWEYCETILHPNVSSLKRASDLCCRLCRIIYSTPTEWEYIDYISDLEEPLNIVLIIDPSKGPHPVLLTEFKEVSGNGARISKRMVASCSGLLNDENVTAALQLSSELDNSHTGSDGALELAAFWTKNCTLHHEKCRKLASLRSTPFVPTRLLELRGECIRLIETKHEIEEGSDSRFVALSHCWGTTPIIRTLNDNYEIYRKGIPFERLSKTFREAIHTAQKLGFRYLWIDSLCIKQDNEDDWKAEAATMCDVYQFAALTLTAAHASGGDIGCFAERDGLLQLPFFIELPRGTSSTRILFTSFGRVKDLGGGEPVLYGRAWCLQEQLLPPRVLIFDGTQLKWECLTIYGSESSPTSGTTRYALYHKAIRSGIMDDLEYFDDADADTKRQAWMEHDFYSRLKHMYWCNLVMDYTHRGMTKSTDRLVALAGVARALNRHTKSQYLAGLWSEHFASGLLWSISHTQQFTESAARGFDVKKNAMIRHEQNLAPSWSWAAVTAPVMYDSNKMLNYDRICDVLHTSVSGSTDKQSGRAEIRGHIRQGYVNPVYPHTIPEAAAKYPHMTTVEPTGIRGHEETNFKGRMFHPNDYFLFSESPPSTGSANTTTDRRITHGNFRFVRGSFRPDQIIDPAQEITFLAIAQQHSGAQLTSRLDSHQDDDALQVHSLALVPTADGKGEYTRVGLAVWDECSWYGYLCGWKDPRDRIVERPGRWTDDGRLWEEEGLWERISRKLWWDDMELYEETEKGAHVHGYQVNCLPDLGKYHGKVTVEEKTFVIV